MVPIIHNGRKATLSGNLDFISLADLFQILGGNGSSGVLHITSPFAPDPGYIYFLKGDPINAGCGSLHGLQSIYTLFGWMEGMFVFYEENRNLPHLIKKNRMEIVLDALRMLDEGVIKRVGPTSIDEASSGEGNGQNRKLPVIKGSLVDYAYVIKEEMFSDGETIVKEASYGKWMWVVMEGTVKVHRDTPNGYVTIARLGEGCFIGTIKALLFGEYARNATVTAEGDVRLCLLDAEHLYREYESLSLDFKALLLSLDNRLRRITDRIVVSSLNQDETKGLSEDKKIIIKKGSSHQELFMVTEGEAFIIAQTRQGDLPLSKLKKGDVFGHIPFMDIGHEPRFASVIASNGLKIQKLDSQSYQAEYTKLPNTFRNFVYHIGNCISLTTSLMLQMQIRKQV